MLSCELKLSYLLRISRGAYELHGHHASPRCNSLIRCTGVSLNPSQVDSAVNAMGIRPLYPVSDRGLVWFQQWDLIGSDLQWSYQLRYGVVRNLVVWVE